MRPFRVDVALWLPVLAVCMVGILRPPLGAGFTLADPIIFAMIAVWLPSLTRGEPRGVLERLALPLLLILLGSVLGAMAVGFVPWVVLDLVKDVGAFASLLAAVTLLRRGGPRATRAVSLVAAVGTIVISMWLLQDPSLRAQASFPNPNVAGHFLGANLLVLVRSPLPRWVRITGVVLCVAALIDVGSFGSLMMVTGGLAYLGGSSDAFKASSTLRWILPVVFVAGFVLIMTNLPETTDDTGFNAKHFDRATSGRLEMWARTLDVAAANPAGLGPGSNRGLGLLPGQQEAHSEYLAYLTERGVIGFAGLLLLYGALWRLGPPGGLTRALVIAYALQSVVRETLHYRHLWLLLALAIVLDQARAREERHPGSPVPLTSVERS
jgi:hypothetical protein